MYNFWTHTYSSPHHPGLEYVVKSPYCSYINTIAILLNASMGGDEAYSVQENIKRK